MNRDSMLLNRYVLDDGNHTMIHVDDLPWAHDPCARMSMAVLCK